MQAKKLHVHFMGVGGSGISAVARIAEKRGFKVSGCDLEESKNTRLLAKDGFNVLLGPHGASHLKGVDLVAHSPAVLDQSATSSEYLMAKKRNIAMIWEKFMADYLQKDKFLISVAGTHGKGTTSAILSVILEQAGLDPTCEIGANLLNWNKRNYRIGESQYFISEADEYRDKFLLYHPNILVVTSIEMDHPDYFSDQNAVVGSFSKLVTQLKDPKILVMSKKNLGCKLLAKNLKNFSGKIIWYEPLPKGKYKLKLPGIHIRDDAAAAVAVAKYLKIDDENIKKALENFSGCERRFEFRGTVSGAKLYDDYAHHPTAVKVNILAARELYPKSKIWVVFQPHMHSRLEKLFSEFAKALQYADRVIVTDVYTRREQGLNKPTGKELAVAVGEKATYVGGGLENVANFVYRNMNKNNIILLMGAGDIYEVTDQLLRMTS